MIDLLQRLRERKLGQWALAYAAGAWVVLQGLDLIGHQFDWPTGVLRGITVVLGVGFFTTLVLAWYHGERGAQKISGIELSILTVLLAIGGLLLWRFAPTKHETSPVTIAAKPAMAASIIPAKSIAVLPFENLSEDKANAYFASGMQDMILTKLADIGDLKVISRTSTEKYKSHPDNLKDIAQQLGVATILEGSVQKSGNQVLINVQLIDANTDSHLWAEAYPRTLDNIFGIEGEVAQKVADALKAKLQPDESARIASVPTRNPEAYDLFLKAENFTRQFDTSTAKDPTEAVSKAADLYTRTIAADPAFALAYARLSYLKSRTYWTGIDHSPQAINAAQVAATQALALQPDLPEAHLAMGYIHYWGHRDYAPALTEFATARARRPNDTEVIAAIAFVYRRQGKMLQAIDELQQAAVLDPRDTRQPSHLCDTLVYLRRYTEAETACDRSLALAPENIQADIIRAQALQMRGDLDGSSRALAAIPADYDPQGSVSLARFDLAMAMRQPDAALAAVVKAPTWLQDGANNVLVPVMLLRGRALARKGESGPARAAFLAAQQALQGLPRESQAQAGAVSNLSIVYAGLGQKDAALAAARRATELLPRSQDMLDGTFYLARLAKIEAQVGETESALKHIEQLIAAPAGYEVSAASLRTDPVWDPLRKDPRFQALLAAHPTDDTKASHP